MADSTDRRDFDRLVYAGLLGLAVAAVLEVQSNNEFTDFQLASTYCFAAAIPLLTAGMFTDFARRSGVPVRPWRDALGFFSALLAVVGLTLLFFHIGVAAGVVFAASVAVAFLLIRRL